MEHKKDMAMRQRELDLMERDISLRMKEADLKGKLIDNGKDVIGYQSKQSSEVIATLAPASIAATATTVQQMQQQHQEEEHQKHQEQRFQTGFPPPPSLVAARTQRPVARDSLPFPPSSSGSTPEVSHESPHPFQQ
jgi:hypothetical protein